MTVCRRFPLEHARKMRLVTHSASGLRQKKFIPPGIMFKRKCSAEFCFWRRFWPRECSPETCHRIQNRLCFLCHFLCTSKESESGCCCQREFATIQLTQTI